MHTRDPLPNLTAHDLLREFHAWGPANRNAQDLRFGQYIHSRYALVPEGAFHTENASEAFDHLWRGLLAYQR